MREIGHFIGGKHVAGTSGKFGDVFNPASGELSARVALAGADEVNKAVAAAAAAWPAWANTPPLRRARVMFKLKELLERDRKEISAIITEQHGKVLSDADGEVQRGLEVVPRLRSQRRGGRQRGHPGSRRRDRTARQGTSSRIRLARSVCGQSVRPTV